MENTVPYNFDDIRPLNNDEVKEAIETLVADEDFRRAYQYLRSPLTWDQFVEAMRACQTKEQFKSTLAYDAVMMVAKNTTFSLDISGRSRLPKGKPACTFISNHRDIVLDASFLNVMLYDVGYGMTQVAIGDNLLIRPWIKTLVRLNNSFIVKRGVSVRQMLEVSGTLSAYINHTIKETKESIWIAQREGRAKDSNDRTQASILKMLNMGGDKDILSNLIALNIVPVSISYEFDPCDYLKAKEFQQKRDDPNFVKRVSGTTCSVWKQASSTTRDGHTSPSVRPSTSSSANWIPRWTRSSSMQPLPIRSTSRSSNIITSTPATTWLTISRTVAVGSTIIMGRRIRNNLRPICKTSWTRSCCPTRTKPSCEARFWKCTPIR